MAQHYRIQGFEQKRFRIIEKGIRANFARTGSYGMRGSLRYIFSEVLTRAYRETGENKDIEVYIYRTKIPKSVYGYDDGSGSNGHVDGDAGR